jgi:spore coat polysaccharide biosynthesis protein SpsF (cytidylyltransferase family)
MLERVVEKVQQAEMVHEIVVAAPHDLEIDLEVPVFIGSETDVLNRYYECAKEYNADTIVRITSDCPLIDPNIIDYALYYYFTNDLPYVIFAPVDGLDVEVFSFDLLEEANDKSVEREHVTSYMRAKTKMSVDNLDDLEKVRRIYGVGK